MPVVILTAACSAEQAEPATVDPAPELGVAVPATPPAEPPAAKPTKRDGDARPEQPIPAPVGTTAADLQVAREQFRVGVEAYRHGKYAEARDAFEAAYDVAPKPQVLYNLAMAERKLGNEAKACEYLEKHVREASLPARQLKAISAELRKCGIQP